MSEGTFELGKQGYYTPVSVAENDFLNEKLENTDYGIYYSVRFSGDAETYLWQSKTAPVPHERYWGHIEKSKSGKSLRFKKDKEEGQEPDSTTKPKKTDAFLRDATTVPIDMIRALLPYFDVQSLKPNTEQYRALMELAQNLTEDALTMVDAIRNGEKSKEGL